MVSAIGTAAGDPLAKPFRVHTVFWNRIGPGSVAYSVTELLDNLPNSAIDRQLWCLGRDPEWDRDYLRLAIPSLIYRGLCKAKAPASVQIRLANRSLLRAVKPRDLVYIWPPYDLKLIKSAQKRGAIVIAERINCMGGLSRDVLSRAYGRRGLALPSGWCTAEDIAKERSEMLSCNYVTAPNAMVAKSVLDAGVPQERILETSYGFNPERLARAIDIQRPRRSRVFAFVGLGIIRKGLDVLLEAWELANVDGTLLIAGNVDDDIRARYETTLARDDVKVLGYVNNIASVYAAADVFVFPSHEEGGPQVTYEAAACGLPSIVSPMGAGRLVRNEVEGLIIDPLDVGDLANALSRLAEDASLHQRLAISAAERSREFTWAKVGMRLCDHFRSIATGREERRAQIRC